jgi:predicted ATPase
MITRLYADNFKTLLNFELPLGPLNLLLGANGSGKSTVLEVVRLVRDFVCKGEASAELFPGSSLCRWDTRSIQTFEIDLRGGKGTYRYRLEIEHEADRKHCFVRSERLAHDQQPIYSANGSGAQLYRDDGGPAVSVLTSRERSGVGALPNNATGLLAQFEKRLEMAWVLHIDPAKMVGESETEDVHLRRDAHNFAAWYRHLALDQSPRFSELTDVLKNGVLDGFRSLRQKAVGEHARSLVAEFAVKASEGLPERTTEYRFSELSDGQRALIALYALAICTIDQEYTICLDHPEDCLALPEIQPWLLRLADATEAGRFQAIIATHHPELINLLAASSGYWLERQSGGPTRVKPIGNQDESGLPVSELIARGWLHG